MITWRLWQTLKIPPYNSPLFRRMANMETTRSPLSRRLGYVPDVLLVLFFIFVFALGAITLVQGFTFITIIATLIIFGGTLYALDWSIAIADVISREREHHTFDLLSLMPAGPFGAAWTIALGQLYRDASFLRRRERFERLILMTLVFTGFLLAIGLLAQFHTESRVQYVLAILSLGAFVLAAYLDFAQSIIVGLLVGVLANTYNLGRLDAQFIAMFGFLAVQISGYLIVYLVGFVVLPTAALVLDIEATTMQLLLSAPRLLIFFLVREATVALLWRLLLQRYNEPIVEGLP